MNPPGGSGLAEAILRRNDRFIFEAPADELFQLALMTTVEPLFLLVLNALRLRRENSVLEALRREIDVDDEPVARRVAVARACGDARGAIDRIMQGGVFPMVPDIIAAAREADTLAPILDLCMRKRTLRSWYEPIAQFHAALEELTRTMPADYGTGLDVLRWGHSDLSCPAEAVPRSFRLAGIIKVHNEGQRVQRTVRQLLEFCDDVVVWDHASTDGSLDELEAMLGPDRARVDIHRSVASQFQEHLIYDGLFERSRAREATHVIHYDADEILAAQFPLARLRDIAARLMPGEAAAIQRRQLVGGSGKFLDFSRESSLAGSHFFVPIWKDFIYADDGQGLHTPMVLHVPMFPQGRLKRRAFLDPAQIVNLHMDMPELEFGKIKSDWYKAKELVLHHLPQEQLLYRYMFYALTYAFSEGRLSDGAPVAAQIDADIERYRVAEKRRELAQWLGKIQLPDERWLFFFDE
jgi:hypothetical protein